MLNSLLLASAIAAAPLHGCETLAGLRPEVRDLVARAWDESDKQKERHQADLKNDVELGTKYAAEVEKEFKLSTKAELLERVERVGGTMATIAQDNQVKVTWGDKRLNKFTYRFKVVEDKDNNAFSLPGGFIYVYEGLIDFCESDDELAGVLAHEVAHASFRHLATLRREAERQSIFTTLPAILVVILSGGKSGGEALLGVSLLNQSSASGWSIKAEQSADYGGLQYMRLSQYNPVGLLTFMERLARKNGIGDLFNLGIYRSHPPSKQRAEALTKHLNDLQIPIRRSEVSTTFRAIVKPGEAGAVEGWFGPKRVFQFAGTNALSRADAAVEKLNAFFDQVPELHEVDARSDGVVIGRRQKLLEFTQEDAVALKKPLKELTAQAESGIKHSLYTLAYRIWDSR